MAARVLRRAIALGLAAAAAGSLHAVATWNPPEIVSSFPTSLESVLLESAEELQAPRDRRTLSPPVHTSTDFRLLLAAREGRTDESLQRHSYAEPSLTANASGSLHSSRLVSSVKGVLLDSAQGLQAALLRAHPLAGSHLRAVRAQAEKDLARVNAEGAEGDPIAAADLHLLVALLAARDGRIDEALDHYAEAARDSPFDPRPIALAFCLSVFAGRMDAAAEWKTSYLRLVPCELRFAPGYESQETRELICELLIAATLGGAYDLGQVERDYMMRIATGEVDAGITAALQDDRLSISDRLWLRAIRIYMHVKVRFLLGKGM